MKISSVREIIIIRPPESIFQAEGEVENGLFNGHWHFSFDNYHDREYSHFGTLRVFNDDTLSPGATWPLHPHRNIEVVTYCAGGVFRHADENGRGDILRKGWVQHTTVGRGLWHAEINDSDDEPMRFIQMWFLPSEPDLVPAMQQKPVERDERAGRLLPLVSSSADDAGALPIASDARVFSCWLESGHSIRHELEAGRGAYLYVLEGEPVSVNGHKVDTLGAAKIIGSREVDIVASGESELLLVEVPLAVGNRNAG